MLLHLLDRSGVQAIEAPLCTGPVPFPVPGNQAADHEHAASKRVPLQIQANLILHIVDQVQDLDHLLIARKHLEQGVVSLGPGEQIGAALRGKVQHAGEDLNRPQSCPFRTLLAEEVVDDLDV